MRKYLLIAIIFTPLVAMIEEEPCTMCCEGYCDDYGGHLNGDRCVAMMPPPGGYCEITGDGQSVTCRAYFDDNSLFDEDIAFCGGYADCDWIDPFCFIN